MAFDFGVGYKASTISISQEVLQKLGQMANGNVMVQMMTHPHAADPMGAAYKARFKCMKCNAAELILMETLMDEYALVKQMEWCKSHKHAEPTRPLVLGPVTDNTLDSERELRIVE